MRKDRIISHVSRYRGEVRESLIDDRRRIVLRALDRRGGPTDEDRALLRTRSRFIRQGRRFPVLLNGIGLHLFAVDRPGHTMLNRLNRHYFPSTAFAGRRHGSQNNGLPYSVTPDILREFRVIDERITVMLDAIDRLVTVDLFLRDRVLTMPFQKQILGKSGQVRLVGRKDHTTAGTIQRLIAVARHHIEIRAREIALVVICRLKDRSRIAGESVRTFLAETVVLIVIRKTGTVTTCHFAIRQVAAEIVDTCIGGIDMEEVGFHRRTLVEPRLGNGVLFVPRIADPFLSAIRIVYRKPAGGIHIPHGVGIEIRLLVIPLKRTIRNDRMALDFRKERIENRLCGRLTVHAAVVTIRDSGLPGNDIRLR